MLCIGEGGAAKWLTPLLSLFLAAVIKIEGRYDVVIRDDDLEGTMDRDWVTFELLINPIQSTQILTADLSKSITHTINIYFLLGTFKMTIFNHLSRGK